MQKRAVFRKVLLGVSSERPRWTQCVELANKRLGMAVGALFIREHFDPESKKTVRSLAVSCYVRFSYMVRAGVQQLVDCTPVFLLRPQALEMIQNIRTAFNEILDENQWMDLATKEVAKQKANAMNERIGYPDFLTNAMELSKEYHLVSGKSFIDSHIESV